MANKLNTYTCAFSNVKSLSIKNQFKKGYERVYRKRIGWESNRKRAMETFIISMDDQWFMLSIIAQLLPFHVAFIKSTGHYFVKLLLNAQWN